MQFTVHSAFNSTAEIEEANKYPNIRLFTVGEGTSSATHLAEFSTISQIWSVATANGAVCWFFDDLKVPIGLFSDNWGGTPVQAWSSPEALQKCTAQDNIKLARLGCNLVPRWRAKWAGTTTKDFGSCPLE